MLSSWNVPLSTDFPGLSCFTFKLDPIRQPFHCNWDTNPCHCSYQRPATSMKKLHYIALFSEGPFWLRLEPRAHPSQCGPRRPAKRLRFWESLWRSHEISVETTLTAIILYRPDSLSYHRNAIVMPLPAREPTPGQPLKNSDRKEKTFSEEPLGWFLS